MVVKYDCQRKGLKLSNGERFTWDLKLIPKNGS